MSKNKFQALSVHKKADLKRLFIIAPLCLSLFLGGCGKEISFKMPEMPDIFGKPDPRVLRTKGSKPIVAQSKMEDEGVSHMESVEVPDVEEEMMGELDASKEIIPVPEPTPIADGLYGKNLFGKSLRSDSDRIDRLERAVQSMRNDFDAVSPSIKRLMVLEGDIQSLLKELQKINENPAMAAPNPNTAGTPQNIKPVQNVPKKQTQATPSLARKAPPPVNNGKASVYDVRIGEHPGKTRIVMDVNAKTDFNVDIDNNEKIMIIELPNADWDTATSKTIAKSPYISSYKVEPSGNGHMLIMQLKQGAAVAYKSDLGGSGGSRRLVVDVTGG